MENLLLFQSQPKKAINLRLQVNIDVSFVNKLPEHLTIVHTSPDTTCNFHFSQNFDLGPEESHSVHKIRTTKIVVEEAPALDDSCGTFIISKSSRMAEVSVTEVDSLSISTPPMEKVVCEAEEIDISALVKQSETENYLDGRDISHEISRVSEPGDQNDNDMNKLMERIMKQRNDLDEILGREENEDKNIEEVKKPVLEEIFSDRKPAEKEENLEDAIPRDSVQAEELALKESSPVLEKSEDNIQITNETTKSHPEGSLTSSSIPNYLKLH